MAKRKAARKPVRKSTAAVAKTPKKMASKPPPGAVAKRRPTVAAKRRKASAPRRGPTPPDPLLAAVQGAERREIGHVLLEVGRAGEARVKRMVYPVGFRWSVDMKPIVGTDLCMHAHVGFLARGEIHIEYADGCVIEHKAPQIVAIEPGHDGWVVGNEPVVLIEFDFEGDTVRRLGMPDAHHHP
jgi:hypothetical protein